jgi:hydrogenase small subunit
MVDTFVAGPLEEIEVLWLTAGLGCDGDTIAMTGASQPSMEDILLGAMPGIPRVTLDDPVLAPESGDDFLRHFHPAAEDQVRDFILVVEGSIPNEHNKTEGFWAAFGLDANTVQPITTCEWIDRLAPNRGASPTSTRSE